MTRSIRAYGVCTSRSDGGRGRTVLVDRVWPRGIKKEKLGADLWLREISSSEELGKWFGNHPDRPERDRRPCSTELTTTR